MRRSQLHDEEVVITQRKKTMEKANEANMKGKKEIGNIEAVIPIEKVEITTIPHLKKEISDHQQELIKIENTRSRSKDHRAKEIRSKLENYKTIVSGKKVLNFKSDEKREYFVEDKRDYNNDLSLIQKTKNLFLNENIRCYAFNPNQREPPTKKSSNKLKIELNKYNEDHCAYESHLKKSFEFNTHYKNIHVVEHKATNFDYSKKDQTCCKNKNLSNSSLDRKYQEYKSLHPHYNQYNNYSEYQNYKDHHFQPVEEKIYLKKTLKSNINLHLNVFPYKKKHVRVFQVKKGEQYYS